MNLSYNKLNVVSVDDNYVNLLLIETMAKEIGLPVKSFLNPLTALEYIENNPTDIVFVDYMMPEMHGIELIHRIRAKYSDIPVIMITAVTDDNKLKIEAIEAGATEFLNKPLNPAEFKARVINLAMLRKSQLLLKDRALLLEDEVEKATRIIREREQEALSVLGRAAEYKDPETGAHIIRVSEFSKLISKELGQSALEQELIMFAAPLHDIGKIGIPDSILTKEGSLTNEEFAVMKTHPQMGYMMLKDVSSPLLKAGREVSLTHHERYNGKGYPNQLAGNEIPLIGRIVALADVFDAVSSKRPYKEAWPLERSLALIIDERGKHFDPDVVDAFLVHTSKIEKIYKDYND